MTRQYERFRNESHPPSEGGYVRYTEDDYDEHLVRLHEEFPNNELVIEVPEDFELKSKNQLNERSSR